MKDKEKFQYGDIELVPVYHLLEEFKTKQALFKTADACPLLRLSLESDAGDVFAQTGVRVGGFFPYDKLKTYDQHHSVDGHIGKALYFYRPDHSHIVLDNFPLTEPLERFALSLFLRADTEHDASLVANAIEGEKHGFALCITRNGIRFLYGDGQTQYPAQGSRIEWADSNWHQVEAVFDRGAVAFFFDGRAGGVLQTDGREVAPSERPVYIGTSPEPGRYRKEYSLDGDLDEVVFAPDRKAVQYLLAPPPYIDTNTANEPLTATCTPVNRTARHFGAPAFHTFKGRPVPLNFLLTPRDPATIKSSALVVYVPEQVQILDSFEHSYNRPYAAFKTKQQPAQREGRDMQRYEVCWDELPECVVLALDTGAPDLRECPLIWALQVNGREYGRQQMTLRFLEPLPLPEKPGRFAVACYMMAQDMTYSTPELQEKVADLYLSSGINRKGLNYDSSGPRVEFDAYLRQRGFQMCESKLWFGALGCTYKQFPKTVLKTGEDGEQICPRVIYRDDFKDLYFKDLVPMLGNTQDGDWVLLDYEPWGWPKSRCFCPTCLTQFKEEYKIEGELTPKKITEEYREQWAQHWVDIGADATELMCLAIRRYNPTLHICEYTYTYDYKKGPTAFWNCPKDPRRHDPFLDSHMLRLYYLSGREAFDGIDAMIKLHKKPVCVISMLADNPQAAESLPPQGMYEKMVLSAALGVKDFFLWSGHSIDGAYHRAMGRACRDIWKVEEFYYTGERNDDLVQVRAATGPLAREEYAHTVWTKDGESLLTLMNFTREKRTLSAAYAGKEEAVECPGNAAAFVRIKTP